MIGRRDGALMRSSSTYTISRANLIIAVAIGMLIGCLLAYFAPSGLLIPISSHVRTVESSGSDSQAVSAKCEPSERLSALKSEFAAASEKNSEFRKKIRELKEKLILAEQRKDNVQKQVLVLDEQQKVGPFGTVKALRTNPTVAPDVSVNPRLAKIMEKVAVNREVIVTLAHSNVKDMLEVWVSSVKRLGITNYLVVTLDEEIAKFCESSNVTVYVTTARTRRNPAVSALKFQILRELVQMGYSVLFSEVDIVYLKNPFDHLYRDSDVESMSDGFDHMTAYGFDDVFDEPAMGWARYAHTMRIWVYNSGFFYIRPTIPSVELLDRVATRLQWVPTSWDQPIMNEELFFPSHPGYDGLHASGRTMDFYLFMNSKVLFMYVRKNANLKKSIKPVVIRVNYHPDKLPRMKAIMEFYVNSKLDALDPFPDGSN